MNSPEKLHSHFFDLFENISVFGSTPAGGLTRLAASQEDGEARDCLCCWLKDNGFELRIDRVGNIFGLKEWHEGKPWVLVGSHLDSQPKGGRLDGTYGVIAGAIAAAEVSRRIEAEGQVPEYNLAVVDWTNEEGARFQPSLIGSGCFVGKLDKQEMLAVTDDQGISLQSALEAIGYLGEDTFDEEIAAYAEIHIEQGRILEENKIPIGVVSRNWAALKAQVTFHGNQAHTGPTRMPERRDALYASAELIRFVRQLAEGREDNLHTSVGRLEVEPNSPNVVPALTKAYVELRSLDEGLLGELNKQLNQKVEEISLMTGCKSDIVNSVLRPVFHFNETGVQFAKQASKAAGYDCMEIDTVAGHDAVSLASVCNSILLFVPSNDGISHNEGEKTRPEDLAAGVDVMAELLHGLCIGNKTNER
ncbi:Zn-dependent hydrolase [Fodinicurvata sediminis]|uniref:Zn-dependent hydrolase n=1 Tax=Fodinicurvata sediminis TaxID=1121832 RepID=UPI0003B4C45D|nr:Zn-dependent hydrolase [Fodinicurvata sediminis]